MQGVERKKDGRRKYLNGGIVQCLVYTIYMLRKTRAALAGAESEYRRRLAVDGRVLSPAVVCARVEAIVIKLLKGRGGQRCLADAGC